MISLGKVMMTSGEVIYKAPKRAPMDIVRFLKA